VLCAAAAMQQQNFEEAFNRIKAATGVNDIEELVRTFIKNEDQNFSLFNYVNEQQNEIEKLEEQLQVSYIMARHFSCLIQNCYIITQWLQPAALVAQCCKAHDAVSVAQ
jgi:hypothetical protein